MKLYKNLDREAMKAIASAIARNEDKLKSIQRFKKNSVNNLTFIEDPRYARLKGIIENQRTILIQNSQSILV